MDDHSNIPGPPVGYTDLLDYEIGEKLKREQEDQSKKYFPLRPSSAGFCSRRLAYEMMEYLGFASYNREILQPNVHRLFELGNSVEYSVLKQFDLVKLINIRYKQQLLTCGILDPVNNETKGQIIEGSCDACFISEKYKCIMDVKSAKDGFSKIFPTRWDETLDKYKELNSVKVISDTAFYIEKIENFIEEYNDSFLNNNILQLNLYACSNFMKERGIDHAVIYKYNKNDSRHYELRFKPSQILADKVISKFNLVNKAVYNKKPEEAPRDYTLGSMTCAFCPFSKECWEGEDAKKKWFKTFPPKKWPDKVSKFSIELVDLFNEFESLEKTDKLKNEIEEKIIKLMQDYKTSKIELENGHVYEVKLLKSPKPHSELRRVKK